MPDLLPFVVIGLVSGSVYGLAAIGIVLTYKTSGVFNFAYGAIATLGAYAFYSLHVTHKVNWPTALFLSVGVLGTGVGFVLERMARRLASVSITYRVVATVGIILLVQGSLTARFGAEQRRFPAFLPTTHAFSFGGTRLSWDQVIVVSITIVATIGLYSFVRFTRVGLAMRGVVDNPDLLDVSGVDPIAVRRVAWIVCSVFASLSGVLLAPSLGLDSLLLTFLIVQAFGAAAIGFFSNLPLAYLGGLVVGIASSIATKYSSMAHPNALRAGLAPSVPFIVLFVVLLATPPRVLADKRLAPRAAAISTWRAPRRVQFVLTAAVTTMLVLGPWIGGSARLPVLTDGLTKVILFLSLGLLVRTSGQVSLCHAALAAVGAAAMAHLTGNGVPWLLALMLAGLIAVPIGALVAIPAIRLSGVFLALATFGFAVTMQNMGYPLKIMFGSSSLGVRVPRPDTGFTSSDRGYYYLVLLFVVLTAALVAVLSSGRLGRILRAMNDSPVALAASGTDVNTARVLVFCISSFLAAVSGALYGGVLGRVTGGPFSAFQSLMWVALLAIVVGGMPWYAFMAAASLVLPGSYIQGADVNYWLTALFGLFAIVTAMSGGPTQMPRLQQLIDRLGGRSGPKFGDHLDADSSVGGVGDESVGPSTSSADRHGAVPPRLAAVDSSRRGDTGLAVTSIEVRYGGHVAVSDVSLSAPRGRVTGLIGPNGAGKTTIFNACCGVLAPTHGEVMLHGRSLAGLDVAARARLGLGRTFQRMELFDSMTVLENVSLGVEAGMAGATPWRHFLARRGEQAKVQRAAISAADLAGVSHLLDRSVGELSTGQRRLVELARCLAGPFDVLLLDEPSSGLTRQETRRFGRVLSHVIDARDLAVLLIEHDMSLVMSACDYVYVLDFGVMLFEGTPAEVAANPKVAAAYLGSEAEALASTMSTVP